MADRTHTRPLAGTLWLLAALSLFWGLNWPAMKVALDAVPVFTFRSLCLVCGGLGLAGLAALLGQSMRIPRGRLGPLIAAAFFNISAWHVLSGYAISVMPAGRGAVIAYTMPMWATLLSVPMLGEPLTGRRLASILLGLGGLGLLLAPSVGGLSAAPLGALVMTLAALSWGFGTVLVKRIAWGMPVLPMVAWQLLLGSVPVVLGTVWIDGLFPIWQIAPRAAVGTIYSVVVAMIFCHWAFFRVLADLPATVAAFATLLIPVIGLVSSALLLGEPLGAADAGALVLITASMAAMAARPAARPRLA